MNHNGYILRPVREDDLDAIYALTVAAPDPITTLPPNREYLERRIHHSLRSFYPAINEAGSESYFFVLENVITGSLDGASAIFARVGGYEAFYTYLIQDHRHRHSPLGLEKNVQALHLKLDHKGPSEIGSLYLSPKLRSLGLGKLMSLSRFLFISAFRQRFSREILVEFRGVIDAEGKSPFWDAVGNHFFGCDYLTADFHSAMGDETFLKDLMPRHPIYLPLLPKSAQEVIGQVHPNTVPARDILVKQGFNFIDQVDIFDAGPVYKATVDDIHAIKHSHTASIGIKEIQDEQSYLLSNTLLDFRSTIAPAKLEGETLYINQYTADLLLLSSGDTIRYLA